MVYDISKVNIPDVAVSIADDMGSTPYTMVSIPMLWQNNLIFCKTILFLMLGFHHLKYLPVHMEYLPQYLEWLTQHHF